MDDAAPALGHHLRERSAWVGYACHHFLPGPTPCTVSVREISYQTASSVLGVHFTTFCDVVRTTLLRYTLQTVEYSSTWLRTVWS